MKNGVRAELVITQTGERLVRRIARLGRNAVYVELGIFGLNKPCGFFMPGGKPIPSNPHKHMRMTRVFHADREKDRK
jgi:hypothetical protein